MAEELKELIEVSININKPSQMHVASNVIIKEEILANNLIIVSHESSKGTG